MTSGVSSDVLVVGGGPSGALTALLLARVGVAVTLVDRARFPRAKACGEFVNPGAIALLSRLGLRSAVTDPTDSVIGGWELRTNWIRPASGSYGGPWGLGIRREDFDARLLDAAREAGVTIREGTAVRGVERVPHSTDVRVALSEDGAATRFTRARILVAADGLNSLVARKLSGLRRPPRRLKLSLSAHVVGSGPDRSRGHMYVAPGLTVGMAAHGPNDSWNVSVVVDPRAEGHRLRRDVSSFVMKQLARVGFPWTAPPCLSRSPLASGPFDRPVRRVAGPGFVLVGDASGYYDPLTGQGIYRALRSAELAAAHIPTALARADKASEILANYARVLERDRRPGRAVQRAIEHVMTSERLRPWMFRRMAARTDVVDALLRVTGDVAPTKTLARPTVWGPLLLRSA